MSLFAAFVFLPVALAIPFIEALPTTRFINAYVEMVSAITTTGATMFDDPHALATRCICGVLRWGGWVDC